MNNRTATLASSAILAILVLSPIGAFAISNPQGSTTTPAHAPVAPSVPNVLGISDVFYGIQYGGCPATMDAYNPSTDTHTSYSLTPSTGAEFCNGRAMAWDGANLWYSVVSDGSSCQEFQGDGFIHEVTTTGGADIATMPDPYGGCGNGIGAMKFDAPLSAGGHLWVESYLPFLNGQIASAFGCPVTPSLSNCTVEISELSVPSGTVLASCILPFRSGPNGAGSDTFSLFTGNEFATDGGEILNTLYFYQEPTSVNAGPCVQVGPPVPTQGATGLNFASNGDCIYTDGYGTTYNGGSNCDTVLASTNNAFPNEEDITCTTLPNTGSLCALPKPIPGAPEFGGPAATILVAAVAMVGVVFLARRKAIVPIASRT